MLTLENDGERFGAGPFDILCIVQESPGMFRAVTLEARGIRGFPRPEKLQIIELEIGLESKPDSFANAQIFVHAFAERIGFEDSNIIADRAVSLGDHMPIRVQNWNRGGGSATARPALLSVLDSVAL